MISSAPITSQSFNLVRNPADLVFEDKHKIDDWLSMHPTVNNRYIPVEDFQAIAAQHDVFGVPTTILYCQGKEVIRRSRYYSLDEILFKGEDLLKIMENN